MIGSQATPLTGAILYAESSTTVIEFPSTTSLDPSLWTTTTLTLTSQATLTIAPKLGASTWVYHAEWCDDDGCRLLDSTSSSCWLLPDAPSSTTDACSAHEYDWHSTITDVSDWPVTITSGAELLKNPKATAAPTSASSSLFHMTYAYPADTSAAPIRLDFGSIVPLDPTATIVGLDLFARGWVTEWVTIGPSTWNYRYQEGESFTVTMDYPNLVSEGVGTCLVSYGGPRANHPGTSTSTYNTVLQDVCTITDGAESFSGLPPHFTAGVPRSTSKSNALLNYNPPISLSLLLVLGITGLVSILAL